MASDHVQDDPISERKPFPRTQDMLMKDDRCAWSNESNSWILEDDTTATEWEWNPTVQKWTQLASEEQLAQISETYTQKDEPVNQATAQTTGKRLHEEASQPEISGKKAKVKHASETGSVPDAPQPPKTQPNRAIYISNLPLQATEADIAKRFEKYGVLARDLTSGGERPRITMYRDENGEFKGDALLVYEIANSVQNAIMLADETDLYDTFGNSNMRVQVADMSYKKEKAVPSGQPIKKAQRSKEDIERYKELARKQKSRLAEWDDDDPQQSAPAPAKKPKLSQHVVCENFFTFDALESEGQELIDDIDSMIRDEAKNEGWGDIHRIVVYDLEPRGIVMIKFETPELAEKAAATLNAWKFDGRQLSAYVSTKKEKFRKTWKPKENEVDDEAARLEAFGRELEADGQKEAEVETAAQTRAEEEAARTGP